MSCLDSKTPSRCTMGTGPSAHALPLASGPLLPPPAPSTFPQRCGSRYPAAHLLYPSPSNIGGHVVYVLAVLGGFIRCRGDGPADGKEEREGRRSGWAGKGGRHLASVGFSADYWICILTSRNMDNTRCRCCTCIRIVSHKGGNTDGSASARS